MGGITQHTKVTFMNFMTVEAKRRKDRYELIYFTKDDFGDIDRAHDDPMVILAFVHNFLVKRILVDQGSLTNILYSHVVEALGLERGMYSAYTSTLVRFTRGRFK